MLIGSDVDSFLFVQLLAFIRWDKWDDGLLEDGVVSSVCRFTPSGNNTVRARWWREVNFRQADWLHIFIKNNLFGKLDQTDIVNYRVSSSFKILVASDLGDEISSLIRSRFTFSVD